MAKDNLKTQQIKDILKQKIIKMLGDELTKSKRVGKDTAFAEKLTKELMSDWCIRPNKHNCSTTLELCRRNG